MIHWRNVTAVVAALVLLPLAAAAAAPAGKVVIAQGVDPTTLDIMNQQKAPASIIAAHIFETLWERDPSLKIVPGLATEMPKLVGPTTDDAVRVAALQNGEVDVAVNIPPHLANPIANHPKLFLTTAPSIRTIQLMFQTHDFDEQTHKPTGVYKGVTADKRVRQAIQYALDVDEIVKGVMDGKAMRMATMLTPLHFGYDPALKPIKQDLARVKKLLAEAGFPNGLELTLNGPQGRYVRDKEVAEAAAGQLTKAGIKTTVKTYEFVNYLNNLTYKHKGEIGRASCRER